MVDELKYMKNSFGFEMGHRKGSVLLLRDFLVENFKPTENERIWMTNETLKRGGKGSR